jgi:hypothetical protein
MSEMHRAIAVKTRIRAITTDLRHRLTFRGARSGERCRGDVSGRQWVVRGVKEGGLSITFWV